MAHEYNHSTTPIEGLNDVFSVEDNFEVKKITGIQIDTSSIPSTGIQRRFVVNGDVGAKFTINIIKDGTINYYNFVDQTFSAGHVGLNNNLIVTMSGKNYYNDIVFPSGGTSYTIKLTVSNGTEVSGTKKRIISKSIIQSNDATTLTFKAITTNTNNYATFPTSITSGELGDSSAFTFNWNITNASTDAHGFGLRITNLDKIAEKYWYFTTTGTVDGAISPSDANSGFKVQVDDVTDIGISSQISAVSAGSLSGSPQVTAIDTSTKTLTLNIAQTFANGITLTFKAVGEGAIFRAIGSVIRFDTAILEGNELEKTVRADGSVADEATDGSNVKIALEGTYGIAGGDHVTFFGVGVDNETSTTVSTITTPSSSAGLITVSRAQALTAGTTLTFSGCHSVINFKGNVSVIGYPTANKIIYLDLDQIITVGAAS